MIGETEGRSSGIGSITAIMAISGHVRYTFSAKKASSPDPGRPGDDHTCCMLYTNTDYACACTCINQGVSWSSLPAVVTDSGARSNT